MNLRQPSCARLLSFGSIAVFLYLTSLIVVMGSERVYWYRAGLSVSSIFAFIVEGVLTPIIHADGPLPVLASLFVGWLGMLAFVGMWYLMRRWLLAAHMKPLAAVGAGFGVP